MLINVLYIYIYQQFKYLKLFCIALANISPFWEIKLQSQKKKKTLLDLDDTTPASVDEDLYCLRSYYRNIVMYRKILIIRTRNSNS